MQHGVALCRRGARGLLEGHSKEGAVLRCHPALFVPRVVETNLPKCFANSSLRKEGGEVAISRVGFRKSFLRCNAASFFPAAP